MADTATPAILPCMRASTVGWAWSFNWSAETHAKYGTTAMVPTTLTSTNEELMTTFTVYRKAKEMNINGSQFIGLHLEGPYFSPKQCGAQDPNFLKKTWFPV